MRTELFGAFLSYCSSQNTNNFRIFCWFGPQMAMRIEFAAQIMKQIWICGFFSCSGRISIYAPNIRCANKLARCKYENLVWSASPNCKQIAYSFCWRERKRKYVSQWQMARSKWKADGYTPSKWVNKIFEFKIHASVLAQKTSLIFSRNMVHK
jgi:hypothetical protein